MSETECHTGRLTLVPRQQGETLEQMAQRVLASEGITALDSYNETWLEQLRGDLGDKYFAASDEIYFVSDKELSGDEDIFDATRNPDGTIDYTLRYYNGGCGFGEALEAAIDNVK